MLEFVLEQIPLEEDAAGGAALTALCVLDADLAVEQLERVPELALNVYRDRWLPELLQQRPERTRQRLLELVQARGRGFRRIADLFGKRQDYIDAPILQFLLHTLGSELSRDLQGLITAEDPVWTYFRFDFLSRIARPDLRAVLEAEAGGELEQMIAEIACSRIGRMTRGKADRVFETARFLLLLIGGEAS